MSADRSGSPDSIDLRSTGELVGPYLEALARGGPLPSTLVDPADEMLAYLRHALRGSSVGAALLYLLQGHQIAATVGAVARWRFGDEAAVRGLLDFASGFGRGTRWLVARFGVARISAVEIDPAAVAFQRRVLGVDALVSATRPEGLDVGGRRFDLIVAASFFSHLPPHRFDPWLARLAGLLEPGGVLLASTHGPALLGEPSADWSAGMLFRPSSETARLDPSEYGTSYATEGFVRAAVERVCPGAWVQAVPFGLCGHQDLYVIVPEPPVEGLAALDLPCHPRGQLEELSMGERRVAIRGWSECASEPGPEVRLFVDDTVVAYAAGGEPGRGRFAFYLEREAVSLDALVRVEAESQRGLVNVLAMGTLRAHLPASD